MYNIIQFIHLSDRPAEMSPHLPSVHTLIKCPLNHGIVVSGRV